MGNCHGYYAHQRESEQRIMLFNTNPFYWAAEIGLSGLISCGNGYLPKFFVRFGRSRKSNKKGFILCIN